MNYVHRWQKRKKCLKGVIFGHIALCLSEPASPKMIPLANTISSVTGDWRPYQEEAHTGSKLKHTRICPEGAAHAYEKTHKDTHKGWYQWGWTLSHKWCSGNRFYFLPTDSLSKRGTTSTNMIEQYNTSDDELSCMESVWNIESVKVTFHSVTSLLQRDCPLGNSQRKANSINLLN